MRTRLFAFLVLVSLLCLHGCSSQIKKVDKTDPFENTNRASFQFTEKVDQVVFKPIAESYAKQVPKPVRISVTNFFNNLAYLNVILNSFLQGQVIQGTSDVLRFVYNSVFGVAGLFDIATKIDIPKHDEDFGQTLAVWGLDDETYIYVPLFGPSTLRDITNFIPASMLNPINYLAAPVAIPLTALNVVNKRSSLLDATAARDKVALDPYSFTREAYLQRREYLISNGEDLSESDYDFFLQDEEVPLLIIE